MTFWGPNGLFLGLGKGPKTVLGSTHAVKQLAFSLFLSILTFDFDLIFGSFFTFGGPNGFFFWVEEKFKIVLGSTHVVEQFSFCMFSSILIFDFYLVLGSFLNFWTLLGYFWVLGRVRQLFWGLLM